MLPALVLAAVYLVWAPPSADLAAQTFRVELFEAHGFEAWTNAWYGGFHLPGYSLLFPPLASVLGVRLVGAISVVAAAWLFGALVRPRYGDRATPAIWLFGLGAATNLFTGRLTFALGLAVALAALLAADRRRAAPACLLAALATCASPIAGLFTAFAGGVVFLRGARAQGTWLAAPALGAIAVLSVLFPTGGVEPFVGNTFTLITAATLILFFVLPREERTLRLGAVLYAAMCLALFLVETPVGGNATRLGALLAAPLLVLGAWGRRPAALVVVAVLPLLYWQWVAPVRDLSDAVGEPSVEAAYYEPLLAELDERGVDSANRVHVPATRNRWESVYVGEAHPLARGWMRQLESDDFELFQDGNLTAPAYRDWLDRRAVAYVAISKGAEPDYLAEDEIELIEGGTPFLTEVWSTEDWELHRVRLPNGIAARPSLAELTESGFRVRVLSAGEDEIPLNVRWSPYYDVVSGEACVREDDGWTVLDPTGPGVVEVEARLDAGGLWAAARGSDERCSPD